MVNGVKNIVKFRHVVGEKEFEFHCENDAPTAAAKEALLQFLKYIGQIEDHVKSQESQKEQAETPAEEATEV